MRNATTLAAIVLGCGALATTLLVTLVAALAIAAAALVGAVAGALLGAFLTFQALENSREFNLELDGSLERGGIWSTYRNDLLVHHESVSGWQTRESYLHWRTSPKERFDADEVVQFAIDHGWKLHARERIRADKIWSWSPNCLLSEAECIEPTNHKAGELTPGYLGIPTSAYRDPSAEFTVLCFSTGMVDRADLETTRRSVVGFASISADGSELFVAHHWGD
jgi:hypothetical protein